MINVVIPMAGKDPNFEKIKNIKQLVHIKGTPLIRICTDSLVYPFKEKELNIIFIFLKEHDKKYKIKKQLAKIYENDKKNLGWKMHFIALDKPTKGAACTVLQAKKFIDNNDELVVYLADIIFSGNVRKKILKRGEKISGIIPVFKSDNPKYSYVKINANGIAQRVAEKRVISENATSGFYFFSSGKDFVACAQSMIRKELNVNGAYYICPVYNELLEKHKVIKVVKCRFIHGLGTLDEISKFRKKLIG